MKAYIVYSGKGGVGKTTTTVGLAKTLLEQGKKVVIVDGDINTPSMSVIFKEEHPQENLWVYSLGYKFTGMIYFEKSMVRNFLREAIDLVRKVSPDFVLIDTPPSITDVHIGIIELFKISGVIIVTQPTELSISDAVRTGLFFTSRVKEVPCVIMENMVTDFMEERVYPYKLVGRIPFIDGFKGGELFDAYKDVYLGVLDSLTKSEEVVLENRKRILFNESLEVETIEVGHHIGGTHMYHFFVKDGDKRYTITRPLIFLNLNSWEMVRDRIMEEEFFRDARIREFSFERVSRLVEAFRNEDEAYFMVINAPCTEVKLLPGEIGKASLLIDEKFYGVPRVKYSTFSGEVILFCNEVCPVGAEEIALNLKEGYSISKDGRYIPPEEVLGELHDMFGCRVGITSQYKEVRNSILAY